MNKLWQYEDYVNHLSHENEIVRHWALNALENRFLNTYTDGVAKLINDENDHLVCAALRYLSFHQMVQYAPAILERFTKSQGIVASNCAVTLAKMQYEPAKEAILQKLSTDIDIESILGILEYLGQIRDDKCREALQSATVQIKKPMVMNAAISNLVNHQNIEDLDLIMGRFFKPEGNYSRHDLPLHSILSPLGGGSYFKDLTEFGRNEILSNPFQTIDNLLSKNSHITMDETLREKLIALIEKRRYQDFATTVMFDARKMTQMRYSQHQESDLMRGIHGQDTMCLYLLEDVTKRSSIWKQLENNEQTATDLVSFVISAYFAIKERGPYVKALNSDAGIESLLEALKESGPYLPDQLQNKIKNESPISGLKALLSDDLMSWTDIWAVRLMGRIGCEEFVPDLIRVLGEADAMDFIYDDALQSMIALDESADEIILTAIKNGELGSWESFTILEHLPYAEAFELALDRWENPIDEGMDSYEQFSSCLLGIGDKRGIKMLQTIYAGETDAGYIGYSLECLGQIHRVEIPELPEIQEKRKETIKRQKTRMKELNEMARIYDQRKKQGVINDLGQNVPFKRKSAKIGRNAPCPCGSGKKYKKCCLGKE